MVTKVQIYTLCLRRIKYEEHQTFGIIILYTLGITETRKCITSINLRDIAIQWKNLK